MLRDTLWVVLATAMPCVALIPASDSGLAQSNGSDQQQPVAEKAEQAVRKSVWGCIPVPEEAKLEAERREERIRQGLPPGEEPYTGPYAEPAVPLEDAGEITRCPEGLMPGWIVPPQRAPKASPNLFFREPGKKSTSGASTAEPVTEIFKK